jgi:hypothetical protein
MKTIFLTIFVIFLFIQISQAQWQPDFRLTNDPALSATNIYPNARCIVSSGDTVHVVWRDNRDGGNYEIYYKRSTDGGISWGTDMRISNNIYFSTDPSISISGSFVHVVWSDNRDGNYEIYYNRSTNGGANWGTDVRLTNDSAESSTPCVSVTGSVVHTVWNDNRNGTQSEIYYKRSTDGGISWGPDTRVTNDSAGSWFPSVSAYGSVVHIVWFDGRNGHQDIFYKRSTDGGLNFGADMGLTNDTVIKNNSSLSFSGSDVYVLWLDSRDRYPNYEIYFKHSTDGGISWGADTRITTNYTSATLHSSFSVSGSVVHVVWDDNRDGNYEIYYKRSTDGGMNWEADTRLTNNSSVSTYPFISASGPVVHVIWMDFRDGNYEIYYKRDPTGNPTGIENISSELPKAFNLEQNYPNPFNPSTVISYSLPLASNVKLIVYNAPGQTVKVLENGFKNAGNYSVKFNAAELSSGIYFYKLETAEFTQVKKMILVK